MNSLYDIEEIKPAKDWFESYKHQVTILDPDGFDRSSEEAYIYSWEQELITEKEFHRRLCNSTVIWSMGKL